MKETDFTQRFVFEHLNARGCYVRMQQTLEDIHATHHYPHKLQRVLNTFALAAVLLHDSIKIDASVTIQLRSPGPIKLIIADCLQERRVRAIAEYDAEQLAADDDIDLSELDSGSTLAITITPSEGDRYQSIVPIESSKLEACLEDYFARSEQLPTWFYFGTDGETAVGLSIHALPSTVQDQIAAADDFSRLKTYLGTLGQREAIELDSQLLLGRLFHEESCRVFETHTLRFGCDCSIERSIEAVYSLGKEDVQNLIVEQKAEGKKSLTVDCHFCFQRYEFDFEELSGLFN